jgi:ethanolamine utilization protein EutQ (cupin superfamily)
VNLASKPAQFHDHWKPRAVARPNDYDVMVVKVQGELHVRLRDRTVVLGPGELYLPTLGSMRSSISEGSDRVMSDSASM